MTTLSDMPMITIEQKNRFREAALEVEKERDELAAQFSEMASLADSLTFASSEDEADEIVQKIAGLVHDEGRALARRDALIKAEALEEAADMARDEVWQQEFREPWPAPARSGEQGRRVPQAGGG